MFCFLEAFRIFFSLIACYFWFCILYALFLSRLPSKLTPTFLFIFLGELQAILPPIHNHSPLGCVQRCGSLDTGI